MADDYGFGSDWYSQLLANLGMSSPPNYNSGLDYGGFTWGMGANLVPHGRGAWDSDADVGKAARDNFMATDQNGQLLNNLGYQGQAVQNGQWSPDALSWLDSQGYNVGVGHAPGSESGGRPEYWGLIDPSGKYVNGQSDPISTISDTPMEIATPFLMMAGPFMSAISTMEGLAAAGGATSSATGASGVAGAGGSAGSGLAAADSGLSSLGSAWSPEALGLTQPIVPATSAGELASLGSGIPSITPSITDMAINGAIRGGVTGGAKSLVQGQNPLTGALQGALGGAITGGIGGGVNTINPDGAGWINGGITGGITSAIGGGNPLIGAAGGALGSLASSAGQPLISQPTTSTGDGMDLGGVGDWFSNWTPDQLDLQTDIAGNVLPGMSQTVGDLWQPQFGDWVSQYLTGQGGGTDSGTSWTSLLSNAVKGGLSGLAGSATGASGGNNALGTILGGLLGAASSKSGTTTQSREPWAAAQPYLKGLLGDAETQRANLAANPYTPQQTQAYGNAYAGLDQARTALPGLLNWGQGAMQRQSTVPSYSQLFGQVKPG